MRKSPLCTCCVCGKKFHRQACLVKDYNEVACSHYCKGRMLIMRSIRKIEESTGINDLEDWLKTEYINNKQSFRSISKELYGVKNRHSSVRQFINFYEIPVRRGSEAIKTQWVNNDKRRKQQAEITRVFMGLNKEVRDRVRKTQQTKEYKLKTSLAKLGNKNPMYGVTGKEHPQWDPERTHEQRVKDRKLFFDKEWRLSVFEKDSYTCKACGFDKGGILVAHHLNGYHWDIDNRYNVDNGVTLCEPCHINFHGIYGYKNNTKEQFDEYMNRQLALF